MVRWFIAHESVHFWLGQAVSYERSRDAWITEGGADFLAVRTVQALDPSYEWRAELNRSISECAGLSRGRGIASAEERAEYRAYYACGALFALLVEKQSGEPYSRFVRRLVDANLVDRRVNRAEWLAAARRATRDESLIAWIEQTLDTGHGDPFSAIAARLERSGIPYARRENGLPELR
jgi:hypothetical protein